MAVLSIDAFVVDITKDMTIEYDKKQSFIKISLIFALFQGIMPLLGLLIDINPETYTTKVAHLTTIALLVLICGKKIYESIKSETKEGAKRKGKKHLLTYVDRCFFVIFYFRTKY